MRACTRSRTSICIAIVVPLVATLLAWVPASADGKRMQRPDVTIAKDSEFDAEHAVRSGTGTADDPYVISGWQMNNLVIRDTDRWITIKDNIINGQLILDWVGDRVHVMGNQIGDLRVNQNVKRTGLPTSGHIMDNTFGVVGQLRHWDGVFEDNLVGSATGNLNAQAVNFDGFNGARFRDNVIYGFMDARLHGHHHSSAYGGTSHMHAAEHGSAAVDHTKRYHEVWITNNKIRTTHEYALAYLDTGHAGNDRTAASEQEEALNKPHKHLTRVHLTGNRLYGAGILVNIFNSPDQIHTGTHLGLMEIRGNRIRLAADDFLTLKELYGVRVVQATDVVLKIVGNAVAGRSVESDSMAAFFEQWDQDAGISLAGLDKGDVWIVGNSVANRTFGVRAVNMTARVKWVVRDLKTDNVNQSVAYDASVANKPAA
jgi:hypothetical protein